jgi:hypothetical protein
MSTERPANPVAGFANLGIAIAIWSLKWFFLIVGWLSIVFWGPITIYQVCSGIDSWWAAAAGLITGIAGVVCARLVLSPALREFAHEQRSRNPESKHSDLQRDSLIS